MNEINGVSVIICCYNSAGRITPTLEHLQKAATPAVPWEVILVDNNSSDATARVALEAWSRKPLAPLKIVEEKKPGLMNARIHGVSVASYNILSFIDDDNWIDEKWIQNVHRIFSNDRTIGACGGQSIAVFESSPPQWFTRFQSSFAVGRQQERTGYVDARKGYLWGAGLSIRRTAWEELFGKGFTSRLSGRKGATLSAGEDSEICLALLRRGWKLWYDDSLTLKHYIPAGRLTEDYVIRMYKGFGKAEVILSVYRHFATDQSPSWFYQFLGASKQMLRSGVKRLFSSAQNRFENEVIWEHDRSYVSELLKNRSNYLQTINAVKAEKRTE